jgi:hypothetical protein
MLKLLLLLALGQDIKLPANLAVQPGVMTRVVAETKGTSVKFVSLDKELQLADSTWLSDPKSAILVATKPGKYKVLAYTAHENNPSNPVFMEVSVAESAPPVPNELLETMKSVFGADSSPTKLEDLKTLYVAYQVVLNTDFNNIQTNEQLFQAVEMIFKQCKVSPTSLPALRDVLGNYFITNMGTDGNAKFDQKKFKELVNNVITALNDLGRK